MIRWGRVLIQTVSVFQGNFNNEDLLYVWTRIWRNVSPWIYSFGFLAQSRFGNLLPLSTSSLFSLQMFWVPVASFPPCAGVPSLLSLQFRHWPNTADVIICVNIQHQNQIVMQYGSLVQYVDSELKQLVKTEISIISNCWTKTKRCNFKIKQSNSNSYSAFSGSGGGSSTGAGSGWLWLASVSSGCCNKPSL